MSADLVFSALQTSSPDLVFGATDAPPITDATVSFVATLPEFAGVTIVTLGIPLTASATMPEFGGTVELAYESRTERPIVGKVSGSWQNGSDLRCDLTQRWQDGAHLAAKSAADWQDALGLNAQSSTAWQTGRALRNDGIGVYQEAVGYTTGMQSQFQGGIRRHNRTDAIYKEADDLRSNYALRFQEGSKLGRNTTAGRYQRGIGYFVGLQAFEKRAQGLSAWWDGVYEEGIKPPAGMWVRPPPGPEPEDPCYLPDKNLVFFDTTFGPDLVFICERHGPGPEPGETVVVPIRRVYMVLNESTLRRVSDNALIPTLSMSMSLDVDSWTWSFSASLPWQALSLVDGSEAVEVKAIINTVEYRFLIEKIGTERSFGKNSIRVSGRGKAALLDSPYAASMFFGNTSARTAQQLMGDVLTINGVPMDWTVNWGITDWLVPGNVWTHQGSYMSALTNIAGAPGAYIQPHPSAQELFVLPRYPAMPHQWADLTPDFDIPAAVATREGIERMDLPEYNRVFVSGTTAGVLGQVTRAGTAGDLIAPMVTDPLITHADAARQRGLSVLSPVGRQLNVTLRMPVLEETGVIPPGKLVLYRDGGVERLGFTRSVQVEVGSPDIWQSIGLETYA